MHLAANSLIGIKDELNLVKSIGFIHPFIVCYSSFYSVPKKPVNVWKSGDNIALKASKILGRPKNYCSLLSCITFRC